MSSGELRCSGEETAIAGWWLKATVDQGKGSGARRHLGLEDFGDLLGFIGKDIYWVRTPHLQFGDSSETLGHHLQQGLEDKSHQVGLPVHWGTSDTGSGAYKLTLLCVQSWKFQETCLQHLPVRRKNAQASGVSFPVLTLA